MITTARKIGNSTGFIINAQDLKILNIKQGDQVQCVIKDGALVIEKIKSSKPKYDLATLMANTNFEALQKDPTIKQWDQMPAQGDEIA